MAQTLYHRRAHARTGHHDYDPITCVRNIWPRRAVCILDGEGFDNDVLRADHLVKGVLEARPAGDRGARGVKEEEKREVVDKKKKKVKTTAVKLDDAVVREYESILAQVRRTCTFKSALI